MNRRRAIVGALAAASAAGCSQPVTGELIVVFDSDLSTPKDISTLDLRVVSGGKPVFATVLGPTDDEAIELPSTLGLLVSEQPERLISIQAKATRRIYGRVELRVEQVIETTVPEDRVATLRVPLQFLCSTGSGGAAGPACSSGQTCLAGACVDARVDSRALSAYDEAAIFAGGACFDVARCFARATPAALDGASCAVDAAGDVNVALVTEGDGHCGPTGCFVALDAESELGWVRGGDGKIRLPEAVCEQRAAGRLVGPGVVVTPASAACPIKTSLLPSCGPWLPGWSDAASSEEGPVVVAGWQRRPASLVLSDTDVYWVEQGSAAEADGAVKRAPLLGGTPEVLAKQQAGPRSLAIAGTSLLWTVRGLEAQDGALLQAELTDVSTIPLLTGRNRPEGVASNEKKLFWTEWSNGVHTADRTGAGEQLIAGTEQSKFPYAIAAANDLVCWTEFGAGPEEGKVACAPLDPQTGAVGDAYALAEGQKTPQTIVMELDPQGNAVAVLWTSFAGGEVLRRQAGSAGAPEVIAGDQDGPSGLAVERDFIYWTNRGSGTVVRYSRAAKTIDPLASGQHNPGVIAVSDDAVFWINEGSPDQANGAVMRRSKR